MRKGWRLLAVALVCPLFLSGALDKIFVTERGDVLDGQSFGAAGPYERIVGTAHFRLDPKNPANRIISDIDLAPVDEDGLVEFSADLYVLKPRDPAKGNGTVLFDVLNRGNKVMLGSFYRKGESNEEGRMVYGDGFLLEQGFTLVWLGWQFDVPHEAGRMRVRVPVAKNPDGTPIVGLVRADFVPSKRITSHSLADRGHIAYPVLDPDDPVCKLTVRDHADSRRTEIPRKKWRFSEDRTSVEMPSGFEAGKIYEVVYQAKDPALVGLGMAGIRDLISYMKYNKPRRNLPLASDQRYVKRAIGYGVSQSGRFLRTFLYYGFNQDENRQQVFDAVWAHVAGGGRGSFNHRFAQPSRDAHPHMNFFYPTDIYPFSDLAQADPETGLNQGILSRTMAQGTVPKIFYTNGSYEYYGRAASLIHTSLDGDRDTGVGENTRIYFLTGTQHGARHFPPAKSGTQYLSNPNHYTWALRALLVRLNRWVTDGDAPPPSQYPLLADKTLAPLGKIAFPKIPGVKFPDRVHRAWRVNYGPEFYTKGIVSIEPPKVGKPFAMRLPQVDADGNELAGVRLPVVAAALGTFTGWNFRSPDIGAPDELSDMIGSYFPFARTKAEREKNNDPRPSVEERYANRGEYVKKVRATAEALAAGGFVLKRDIDAIVTESLTQWDFVMGGGKK